MQIMKNTNTDCGLDEIILNNWEWAWNMGAEFSKIYATEEEAEYAMDSDTMFEIFVTPYGCDKFFHAGFTGKKFKDVDEYKASQTPLEEFSSNWEVETKRRLISRLKKAWELGAKYSKMFLDSETAYRAMDEETLKFITSYDCGRFFDAGFSGIDPEWVEAIRFGEIPKKGFSINWADNTAEDGVSVVNIIRKADDENLADKTIYSLYGDKKIRIAGWYLGQHGSDGEPLLIKCKKIKEY